MQEYLGEYILLKVEERRAQGKSGAVRISAEKRVAASKRTLILTVCDALELSEAAFRDA